MNIKHWKFSFKILWNTSDMLKDLEKEMATHSSVLAWRIPWTEKPGRLQSMGSHRVGHNWSDLAAEKLVCIPNPAYTKCWNHQCCSHRSSFPLVIFNHFPKFCCYHSHLFLFTFSPESMYMKTLCIIILLKFFYKINTHTYVPIYNFF